MLEFDIQWKALKNLGALQLEDQRFLQWLAPRIAKGIRERTLRGRLPDGSATFPLSSPAYAKWKTKKGAKPIRDAWMTGRMWRGLTAKVDNKERFVLFFSGSHGNDTRTRTIKADTKKHKKGDRVTRNLRNQEIANIWAGRGEAPRSGQVPDHAFMAADDRQERMIQEQYEKRVIWKGLKNLPNDTSQRALFVMGSGSGL